MWGNHIFHICVDNNRLKALKISLNFFNKLESYNRISGGPDFFVTVYIYNSLVYMKCYYILLNVLPVANSFRNFLLEFYSQNY